MNRHTVLFEKMVYGGRFLGRLADGRVLFAPFAVPGEEAVVAVRKEHRDYVEGEIESVLSPSPLRRVPPCPLFGKCGGCHLQHVGPDVQREWKRDAVREIWKGAVPVEAPPSTPEFGYRHRARFRVLRENAGLAFRARDGAEDVQVADCALCADAIREAMPWVRDRLLPRMSEAGIFPEELAVAAGDVGDLAVVPLGGNPVHLAEWKKLREWSPVSIGTPDPKAPPPEVRFSCGPWEWAADARSFFQANLAATAQVVGELMRRPAGPGGTLELYAGMGVFTAALAARCGSVLAVDGDALAGASFAGNMRRLGVRNVRRVTAAVEEWLRRGTAGAGDFDTLFLDPPRTGLSRDARRTLPLASFEEVLYLSCDPATQRRDTAPLLSGGREFGIRLFDFFPNTYHVESYLKISEGRPRAGAAADSSERRAAERHSDLSGPIEEIGTSINPV